MGAWPEQGLGVVQERLRCSPAWLGSVYTGQGSCGPGMEPRTRGDHVVTCHWEIPPATTTSTFTPTQALTHIHMYTAIPLPLSYSTLTTILGAKELF